MSGGGSQEVATTLPTAIARAIDAEARGVDDVLRRVSTMLAPGGGGSFAAAEAPVSAANRAAAQVYDRKPAGGGTAVGEAAADTIERMARSADLTTHQVALSPGWERRYALPMVAMRRADGVPLALVPSGGRWRVVPGDRPHATFALDAEGLAELGEEAYALCPTLPDSKVTLKTLFWYGWRSKLRDLAGFGAMTLLAGLVLALVPIANIAVTDVIIPGREVALLGHVVAMMVTLVLASLATRLAAELSVLRINGRTSLMLRVASADRMIRVSRGAGHGATIPPAAAALVTRCVESWHRGSWGIALSLATACLIALPSLAVMLLTAPSAAIVALAVIAVATGFAAHTARRQVRHLFAGPSSPTSWISLSHEALAQIEALRAYGAERRFFALFAESFLSLKERFLVTDRLGARLHALERALEAVVLASGIAAAILLHRHMAIQESVAFTVALMTVTGAAVTLVHSFLDVSMLGLQQRMIQPLLDGVPAAHRSGLQPGTLAGDIIVEDIVVRRDKHARPIVDRVSLAIAPGEHVAIVGPSGSGKTTLLRAILGLEALESGRVRYDGVALDRLDAAAVRRQIGVVGQAGQLLPGTLYDNICLGVRLSESAVWEALRLAAIDDEVAALPLGLSTPIGDAGPVFSGGQIQRLLLARAVAQRPRIVVLDEATSALDPAREARVAAALDGLRATTLTVAHRLDTIRHCDRIHVLDQGRIVETGDYASLMAMQGAFAGLVAAEARAATR